jgi:mannosyltransferase
VLRPTVVSVALLTMICVVGLVLRAVLMGQSLLGDELFTFEVATRDGLRDVLAGVRSDLEVTPPLHFVAAWASAKVGDPRLWLRIPSLIAGTAAIPLVYALGRSALGRGPALLAAALMALSPFAIFYSVEARAYGLLMALLTGSTLALLGAVRGDRLWLVVYGVLACAALYTHYTAAFVLAAQGIWALWTHREMIRELLVVHAAVAAAFAPWIPFLLEDARSGTQRFNQVLAPLSPESLADALATWILGSPFTNLWEVPGAAATVLIGAGLGLAAVAGLSGRPGRPQGLHLELGLLVAVALASPAGAVVYSLGGSSFLPRNLIGSLPALLLLMAALLLSPPRPYAAPAAGLVIVGFALGAVATLSPDQRRPAYREAAELIDSESSPRQPVVEFLPIPTRSPAARTLEVNLERPHPLFRAGFDAGERRALRRAVDEGLTAVVTGSTGARRPPLSPDGLRLVGRTTFRGLEPVTVYRYEPTAGARDRP